MSSRRDIHAATDSRRDGEGRPISKTRLRRGEVRRHRPAAAHSPEAEIADLLAELGADGVLPATPDEQEHPNDDDGGHARLLD